jgi:tetraacyldisaccharide 4'-kinase
MLSDMGERPSIHSRGYARQRPSDGVVVVSDGHAMRADQAHAGDEPYMLARNLPGVIVLVDKNRVTAGAYAIKKFGCDTLVLDDGFQYLPLKGRLNLLLVDKTNPFGNGHMLPRGILREPIKHLRRASYVFLTKSNGQRDAELERLIEEHNPGVDIIECAHRPQYLQRFGAAVDAPDAREPLTFLQGRRVFAFSGIATPESFEKFLRDLGALIVGRERFLDHYRYAEEDLAELAAAARREGADCIVTTEKDAVRIAQGVAGPLPLYYLRLEIDIIRGAADFDEAVSRICFPTDAQRRAAPRAAGLNS